MEKYGFVYLWFDKRYQRFYVGSHWGTETDKYICSSNSMRDAHRRRPEDFKRKILAKIHTNRVDLLNEEQRFLDMIKPEQFGRRYYNINSKAFKHSWWMNEDTTKIVADKISKANAGKPRDSATKFHKDQTPWNKGKVGAQTAWNKDLPTEQQPGFGKPCSAEKAAKISAAQKGVPRKSGMEGRQHSEVTKQKIRETKQAKGLSMTKQAIHMRQWREKQKHLNRLETTTLTLTGNQ